MDDYKDTLSSGHSRALHIGTHSNFPACSKPVQAQARQNHNIKREVSILPYPKPNGYWQLIPLGEGGTVSSKSRGSG